MVHCTLLLVHWLSLWYTTIFYWPKSYLFGTLPSPTGPLVISIYTTIFYWPAGYHFGTLDIGNAHSYLLLTHWISLWYITLSLWPTGYSYVILLSSTGPLDISMVHYLFTICPMATPMLHCHPLLAHWISLWYTTLSYWPTGYLYGTLSFLTGLLAIHKVLFPHLLAHCLSL